MTSILDTGTDQQLCSECLVFIDKIKQMRDSETLLRHVNKSNQSKLRQGGICDRFIVQANSQFNSNNRVPTHIGDNHMNDNNNNHYTNVADITNSWVVNPLSTPLTDAQTSLLAKGPKYTIVPRHLPESHYVTAVEEVCQWLATNVNRAESRYQ